ncbi:MarR family winged helix-turn-helix transcriptional regulator [Croceicoccus marinus]|uniref:MarR family transcriptional regulator n=1 Tax=Croceicoccus marinus TaxID=450378 RepID=A0A7G6VZX6_9SPHN|nr:MarR family transcriptional regulator [Croceicoccus marinus]QNE07291.1 MarR family transcriptional regulator [Croceicoccus marinus]
MAENLERGPDNLNLTELESTLGFLVLAAWRYCRSSYFDVFNDINVSPGDYGILVLIDQNPDCNVGQISNVMQIAPNNTARAIDRWENLGYIDKRVNTRDARVRTLRMTQKGKFFLSDLRKRQEELDRKMCDDFGKDRIEALQALLRPFARR